jgi:hypothetical protein
MALAPRGSLHNSWSSGIGFPGAVAALCEPRGALASFDAVGALFLWHASLARARRRHAGFRLIPPHSANAALWLLEECHGLGMAPSILEVTWTVKGTRSLAKVASSHGIKWPRPTPQCEAAYLLHTAFCGIIASVCRVKATLLPAMTGGDGVSVGTHTGAMPPIFMWLMRVI